MNNLIRHFFLLTSILCFAISSCKPKTVSSSKSKTIQADDSESFELIKLWQNNNNSIHYDLKEIDGIHEIGFYSQNNDVLLSLEHDEGGSFTEPFVVNKEGQSFIVFFTIWNGSGNLSEKHIYHINSDKLSLNKLKIISPNDKLESLKIKSNISDKLAFKKGEFYKNFGYDKSCFDDKGNLEFSLTIFNESKPELNNGLEGFKLLKGHYNIYFEDGQYIFGAKKLRFVDVN